jgi:hypothetical protein
LAIDPATILVNRVHLAWKDDNIMGVLLVDINGAFPRLVKGRLIRVMIPKKIEGDLIHCDRCSFLGTPVQMVIKDNVLQNHLVEAGIPQCLLVSLILHMIPCLADNVGG